MEKVVLIDGNNLMFRSYYATAYTGNLMKNSKGFYTNALYGFVSMINKIIEEENPIYMAVAFDIGKNFRKDLYKEYKDGRKPTPDELKMQMPVARKILDAMGIKYYEIENYEADDIIGTLSYRALVDPDYVATVISSDKDLLQLINEQVEVKLLKSKDYIRYNKETFINDYGFDPIRIIDLKALMGDASDNIPGVKGIGEKTAIKLIQEYDTIENLYENIDNIKGKLKEKLIDDKENAFFSKKIATIYLSVPILDDFDVMKYNGEDIDKLTNIFEELEFYSFMKKFVKKPIEINNNIEYKTLENVNEINKDNIISYYIECDKVNYHYSSILGMGLYDGENLFFVKPDIVDEVLEYIKDSVKYTFDLKKNNCLVGKIIDNTIYDHMIVADLLNYNFKEDLSILMKNDGINIDEYSVFLKTLENLEYNVVSKAKYIYDIRDEYIKKLKLENMYDLFIDVEMPLVNTLTRMELNGIKVDKEILHNMGEELSVKIEELKNDIYSFAGEEFNISSPKQLGNILFEKLGLKHGKKIRSGYSTDSKALEKIMGDHPIVPLIVEYRNLTKIYGTYIEGLSNYIMEDGKIHTIYKQTMTRTGRLSSVEPNLQNIPARDELGKMVRRAFIPTNDVFLSADYSQIELRILAHISDSKDLIDAYVNGEDIHTKVASDIFAVPKSEVSKEMRSAAKAVIFGIVYGISGFGLGENIGLSTKDAKLFIDKYYELYPGVKKYMDNIVHEAYMDGSVRTLLERKRVIDELNRSNYMERMSGERIALNTPIQGTSADIIKMAMVKIDEEFIKRGIKSKMLLQIHDELVFDIVDSEKEEVSNLVRDIMKNIVSLKVPLEVSQDFGTDLYETK